jgi:hypothetical protein
VCIDLLARHYQSMSAAESRSLNMVGRGCESRCCYVPNAPQFFFPILLLLLRVSYISCSVVTCLKSLWLSWFFCFRCSLGFLAFPDMWSDLWNLYDFVGFSVFAAL